MMKALPRAQTSRRHPIRNPEPVWCYRDSAALRELVERQVSPWVQKTASSLALEPVVPPTVRSFVERPYYRPPGSFRCFYHLMTWPDEPCPQAEVIAVKGMEPSAPDFESSFVDLRRPCYSPHDIAEHLIFEERKIPGAVGLPEALREAEHATHMQVSHYRQYGHLARMPLPLFVFRHTPRAQERVKRLFARELSQPAFDEVEAHLERGLGVYVYHYPAAPIRVRDIETMLIGLDFRRRMLRLLSLCDPEEIVRRWTSLFARMLHLGWVPGTLAALRTGLCCQPQNSCMDGGFVDLESIAPFGALRDDQSVFAALQLSTDSLVNTAIALLTGSAETSTSNASAPGFHHHFTERYVMYMLAEAVAAEAKPDVKLDSRVSEFFAGHRSFVSLTERLATLYPHENAEFARGAQQFGHLAKFLLRSLQERR
jgi:hypothetical protein